MGDITMNTEERQIMLDNMNRTISNYLGSLVLLELNMPCSVDKMTQEDMDRFINHAKATNQLDKIKHVILMLNINRHWVNAYPKDVLEAVSGIELQNKRIEKINTMMKDDFPKKEIEDHLENIKNAFNADAMKMGLTSEMVH
jgi:hypothetical protein